jgi:DNA-binding transcriptional ArsR family regulator
VAEKKVDIELIFEALGDATRRRIVDLLSGGPASVSALAKPLGITITAVAQHLRILEQAQLVATEKVGRVRTCRLETRGLTALRQWAEDRRSTWDKRLDRLAAMFEEKR